MKSTIEILVRGTCGSGKSSVSLAISEFLKGYNIPCKVKDDTDNTDINFEKRLNSLSERGLEVEIKTVQLYRR